MTEPLKQVVDENVSDLPYHDKETEAIAVERAKAVAESEAEKQKEADLELLGALKAKYEAPAQ